MPVNNTCAEYTAWQERWKLVRDVVSGEEAVKNAGTTYLPRPNGQIDDEYTRYKQRAHFFDGVGRTAEAFSGNVFSKEPVQTGDVSDEFAAILKNVDGAGRSLRQFSEDVVWDAMQTYQGAILVDYSPAPEEKSEADTAGNGYRAYMRWYNAESVINWRREVRNGRTVLTLVVLKEPYEYSGDDKFTTTARNRYRALILDESGRYYQELYDEADDLKTFQVIEPKLPDGQPLDFIPCFFCPFDVPNKSILLGLAYESIGLYQKSADYENGLHWTGIPTPVVENMDAQKDAKGKPIPVPLGGSTFLFFREIDADVRVHYLEFSGEGLHQLAEAIDAGLYRMGLLGARAIGSDKKGVETAETARIYRSSENAVLKAFARAMSEQLTRAVRLMAQWNRFTPEMYESWSYALNTDYDDLNANAQMISVILSGRMNNEVPRYSVYKVLKEAEQIPDDWSFETFAEELAADNTGAHGPDGEAA
ncbi:MAG: DUF4055 domain-containing protein [Treponema sp.]|nr:DUF4055 domain-containing protein [Treponema sp.]